MRTTAEDNGRLDKEIGALNGVKPINQSDDRKDWYAVLDPVIQDVVAASPAIITQGSLVPDKTNSYRLRATILDAKIKLCEGERFGNQLQVAYCSAVLIGADVIATAGHCVRGVGNNNRLPALDEMRVVFGYRAESASDPGASEFGDDQIFGIDSILDSSAQEDWALLKLNRSVPSKIASPIQVIASKKIAAHQSIYVVGYPSGLPVKYADGAEVKVNDNPKHFVANLDTFRGNSGSGVFSKADNGLVGLLVGGATDYYPDGTVANACFRAYRCSKPNCGGEIVTRVELVRFPLGHVQ
ncbi:trypsin-like serine peptidase [Bradyrhizobium sp. SZCCHNRI1058]|uniref:trypsin-like serine peptidase n=1 Tax=Bradyrhizobium sp. SZCCHNRI1058 TaxID=3057279 RepID=UPI002916484F|nr:trypsin-like peptidase domain-containing protein [Bradyrhizobium sp. SZCCHNRI1058]